MNVVLQKAAVDPFIQQRCRYQRSAQPPLFEFEKKQ
jgi:hypothetical protein